MGQLVAPKKQRSGQVIQKHAGSQSALSVLPNEWHEPVSFFYAFHSEILKGTLCLATRFKYWMTKNGLTLGEANQAMMRLMEPEVAGDVTFGAQQLQGMLADAVGEIVAARNKRLAAAAARKLAEETKGEPYTGPPLSDLIKGVVDEKVETESETDKALRLERNRQFAEHHGAK